MLVSVTSEKNSCTALLFFFFLYFVCFDAVPVFVTGLPLQSSFLLSVLINS